MDTATTTSRHTERTKCSVTATTNTAPRTKRNRSRTPLLSRTTVVRVCLLQRVFEVRATGLCDAVTRCVSWRGVSDVHDDVYAGVLVALCTAGGGGDRLLACNGCVCQRAAVAAALVLRRRCVTLYVFVGIVSLTAWLMLCFSWSSVGAMDSPTAAAAPAVHGPLLQHRWCPFRCCISRCRR